MSPLPGGLAGLAQISLLPGVLALLWSRKYTGIHAVSRLSAILFVFCFSAVASFSFLLLLQAVGSNVRLAWLFVALIEVLAWLHLVRKTPSYSARDVVLALPPALHWPAIGFFLVFVAKLCAEIVGHWPGVLEQWDAVINWNRWALDWAAGRWPYLTWGYSQLVPAMWAILYVLQDSTEIEFFVRGWMGLFPLALMVLFFDMFLQWRRMAPLLAAAAMVYLLLGPYAQVLDSGYVDTPLAFFILLAGHWALLVKQDATNSATWLLFAVVAAAGALLTKQGGIFALAILCWSFWHCRQQRAAVGYALALLILLVAPWQVIDWVKGAGDSIVPFVTSEIYGAETVPQRIVRAISTTLPAIVMPSAGSYLRMAAALVALLGILSACKDERGRFCAAIGFCYLLIWAAFFSYDGRNLLPAMPFLLLAMLTGLEESLISLAKYVGTLPNFSLERRREINMRMPSRLFPPVLLVLLLIAAMIPVDPLAWEKWNNDRRKQTGDGAFNQQLIDFVSRPGFSGSIYTTYPQVAAIRELRPYLYVDFGVAHQNPQAQAALQSGQPICTILSTFPRHQDIRYMLLHDTVYPAIIDAAVTDGSLEVELDTPLLRLMRVNCAFSSVIQP